MLEKIKQKLIAQRKALEVERGDPSHVSDRSIEDLAKVLESLIAEDKVLEKFDFSTALESINGNIHKIAKEAVQAAEKKAQKAKKSKKSKKDGDEEETAEEKIEREEKEVKEVVPSWAKGMVDSNKSIVERLDNMEADKTSSTRKARLQKALKDTPPFYSKPLLNSFDKMKFEDDDEFEEYLSGAKGSTKDFMQQASENGLKVTIPDVNVEQKDEVEGQTEEIGNARDLVKKANEKNEKTD